MKRRGLSAEKQQLKALQEMTVEQKLALMERLRLAAPPLTPEEMAASDDRYIRDFLGGF